MAKRTLPRLSDTYERYHVLHQGAAFGPFTVVELRDLRRRRLLASHMAVRPEHGKRFTLYAHEIEGLFADRIWLKAILFSMFLGFFGVDRLYLKRYVTGVLKAVTLGGLGVWWAIDLLLVVSGLLTVRSGLPLQRSLFHWMPKWQRLAGLQQMSDRKALS